MSDSIFLIVFPGGDYLPVGERSEIAKALDQGDIIYFIDGNIGFVRTPRSLAALTDRLKDAIGSTEQFFIADITQADRSGNMASKFWQFLRQAETEAA